MVLLRSIFLYLAMQKNCTIERGPFLGKWCFSSPFRHNWTYRINLGTQKISVQLKGDQTLLVAAWLFSKPFWFMISDLKTYKNQSTRNMYIRSRVRVLSRSISFTQVCLCLAIDKKKSKSVQLKGDHFQVMVLFNALFMTNLEQWYNLRHNKKLSVQLKGGQTLQVAVWLYSNPFWLPLNLLKQHYTCK